MENYNDLKAFLLTCVDFEGAGYPEQANTLENVADNLWSECAQYNRGPRAYRFKAALQGLPSYINMPFCNYDIECLMYSLGFDGSYVVNEYWNACGYILEAAQTEKGLTV